MDLILEEYREAIRISYAAGIAFFFYMTVNAAVNVKSNKEDGSVSYLFMSAGIFLYSLLGFIQTFPQLTEYAMYILKAQLITALVGYFAYLCTIEKVLQLSHLFIKISKGIHTYLITIIIVSIFYLATYDQALFFKKIDPEMANMYSLATNMGYVSNPLGDFALGFMCVAGTAISASGVLYLLRKNKIREPLIATGVGLTLLVVINDVLIVMTEFTSVPLAPLGYVLESIRFSQHFLQKTYQKIDTLESENRLNSLRIKNNELSKRLLKVLSHDIADGLFIITKNLKLAKSSADHTPDYYDEMKTGVNSIKKISSSVIERELANAITSQDLKEGN